MNQQKLDDLVVLCKRLEDIQNVYSKCLENLNRFFFFRNILFTKGIYTNLTLFEAISTEPINKMPIISYPQEVLDWIYFTQISNLFRNFQMLAAKSIKLYIEMKLDKTTLDEFEASILLQLENIKVIEDSEVSSFKDFVQTLDMDIMDEEN